MGQKKEEIKNVKGVDCKKFIVLGKGSVWNERFRKMGSCEIIVEKKIVRIFQKCLSGNSCKIIRIPLLNVWGFT